ncbi:MAG: hypothetical protein WCT44_03480 [Candidatus Paceibacterota bacterium]
MAVLKKKKKIIKKKVIKKKTVKTAKKRTVLKRKILKKKSSLKLERSKKNPIIEPAENVYWESKATFNPSAIYSDGKIHVIYRAIGDRDMSVLGYAKSNDGIYFDNNSKQLAYYAKAKFNPDRKSVPQITSSGGGWGGGCEDPRLTLLGGMVYMLYTAFDGWGSVRIALTSVSLEDFINKRFSWREPVLISPPGEIHKNWALFPEKIKGKYAILHAISPKIMIDYFKDLRELDGKKFIHSVHQNSPLWKLRDGLTRGIGPSPIKTKIGWLILYHKIEKNDPGRYKLWAMILDSKDPTKILYKNEDPILAPDLWYENEGYKAGTVYSCGAVVKDGKLFVYYGGADTVSCVATANLDKFLEELKSHKVSKLKKGE